MRDHRYDMAGYNHITSLQISYCQAYNEPCWLCYTTVNKIHKKIFSKVNTKQPDKSEKCLHVIQHNTSHFIDETAG